MLATPPRPRNAVTEFSITPLRPKTSSVPLDGRVLKAATVDADLATELENASIYEQAGLNRDYITFWCTLSSLKNLQRIKAKNLKTDENKPFFLGNYWDPVLIPAALRLPELAEPATSSSVKGSKTRQRRESNPSKPPTASASATAETSSSRSRQRKRSLRRQTITQTIPNVSVVETIEATVIPLAGSEEMSTATWLNHLISAFQAPQDTGDPPPGGWKGLHLTPASSGQTQTVHPLRVWSSQYSLVPVENSQLMIKPDVVFCGQIDPQTGFSWHNVISFLELTSSEYSAPLRRNIIRKVYAVFMSQPLRRFVVALSIARQEFRLHRFDRSGAIHSLGHNIHKSANLFARLLYVLAFAEPSALGFDPTFYDSSLSPSILYRPRSTRAINNSRLIYIRDVPYTVIRPIFISRLIQGRATSSWAVRRGRRKYVIKDYWTNKGRKITEEQILEKIAGLRGVPQLVEAWTVEVAGIDDLTDLSRPDFLVKGITFDTRSHRRLVMTPIGEPLLDFKSLQELVSTFIDIVQVHFILVTVYCVLHRDISLHNILMYVCPERWPATSDTLTKREDVIARENFRRGLLIDYDYASFLNKGKQGVSDGDRTGTVPFMAIDLLRQYANPTPDFVHTFAHDLEALIYVLVWVCIVYQAPNEVRRDKSVEQTCLKQWANAKTINDIESLYDQKLGQLLSKSVLEHFTPYFEPLNPFVERLYDLLCDSRDPRKGVSLTHEAVMDILIDAFNAVQEVSCGATNAKRTWQTLRNAPVPNPQTDYYSEGRNVRRRVAA